MSRTRAFCKYWLPVLIWMIVIFSASGDSHSVQRSSRIIGPILLWLFPDMPPDQVRIVVLVVRKCAHLTEYAILALLCWRALHKPVKADPRPWSWRTAGLAILIVTLYASSDELHQLLVPGREARAHDVFIDISGGIVGLLCLWALHKSHPLPQTAGSLEQ